MRRHRYIPQPGIMTIATTVTMITPKIAILNKKSSNFACWRYETRQIKYSRAVTRESGSIHLFQTSRKPATSHACLAGKRGRERARGREREGDNKTTVANSYRFEILRNKVYTRRAGTRYNGACITRDELFSRRAFTRARWIDNRSHIYTDNFY